MLAVRLRSLRHLIELFSGFLTNRSDFDGSGVHTGHGVRSSKLVAFPELLGPDGLEQEDEQRVRVSADGPPGLPHVPPYWPVDPLDGTPISFLEEICGVLLACLEGLAVGVVPGSQS